MAGHYSEKGGTYIAQNITLSLRTGGVRQNISLSHGGGGLE